MTRFIPAFAVRLDHLVPACAVIIVLVVAAGTGEADPGQVDGTTARWAALGLLAAPAVMIYIHRGAAAIAAAVCAAGWVMLAPGYGWSELLTFAYALVTAIVARRAAAGVVPVPLPPLTLPSRSSTAAFADAPREALADVPLPGITLTTTGPPAGSASPASGRLAGNASPASDRPAGDEPQDSAGRRPGAGRLAQPPAPDTWPVIARAAGATGVVALAAAVALIVRWGVSDDPAWAAAALVAAGAGAAAIARARGRRRALRRLFGSIQPVRHARVVDQLGYLHVLVPAADGRSAVEFGVDTADDWSTDDEAGDPQTRPALLYGSPATGEWCAIVVDGRLHVPTEPVGTVTVVPYDADHGLPREISDDEEQLVDPDELRPDDHLAPPEAVHEHRVSPARGWCTVATIGLGSAFGAAEAMHVAGYAGDWPSVAVVAAASAAAVEFAWRSQIRQRLLWNLGGVTSIGFRGAVTEPWTVDTAAVHDDEGAVTLAVGESVVTVPVPPPWPRSSSQRTRDQLVAALRDARWQAFATPDLPAPPPAVIPRRPLLLAAAWTVAVAAAVALFAG
ncbi:hypothetical protein [Actinoplanes sp. NBRC 103695]|uniref:hypothetical protein n=1 Tax=Actinoplanes sp. NBRC 103695 TaxID=3032202 RepID=UPI0025552648|nr:hypothetical protein [Actinoplanes sp. NBRC 103695]